MYPLKKETVISRLIDICAVIGLYNVVKFCGNQFFNNASKIIRHLPIVKTKITNVKKEMKKSIFKESEVSFNKLPDEGIKKEEIVELINKMPKSKHNSDSGKISGAVYNSDKEFSEFIKNIMFEHFWSNPLHADLFPQIRQMEVDIVKMCSKFYKSPTSIGCVTSGGTESIILACRAYKNYSKHNIVTKGEIVALESVHTAFDKAAELLDLKLIKVKEVEQFYNAINANTILIVGSAPAFPHGEIDPIKKMSRIALKYEVPFHVDACLGGFLIPFADNLPYEISFNLLGITSISLDTHKYGYGPKGGSVLLYRSIDYIHEQYFVNTDWIGGIYISPTLAGSRNGSIIAGTWAAMLYFGHNGYKRLSNKIIDTVQSIKKAVEEIPEVEVIGNPQLSVIAFTSDKINIFCLMDYLSEKGWNLNSLQFPAAFHLCVTAVFVNENREENFIEDLKEGVEYVKNIKNGKSNVSGTASAIYGTSQKIPDRSIVRDITENYQDLYYDFE